MKRIMKISKGGQISVPAEIRKRWATSELQLTDEGHRVVLEPAPEDAKLRAIENAYGALAEQMAHLPPTPELMRQYKAEQLEAERRK